MKKIIGIIVMGSIFSCSNKDPKMCECLKASDELNQFSAELLTKQVNQEDAKKMQELKTQKTKKCAGFQEMSGEEMLKKKAACKD